MFAGALDRYVTIQYPVITKDATYGSNVTTWANLASVWAQVQDVPPSRSEAVKTGLDVARNQSKVTIRWRGDVDSRMRIIIHYDTDFVTQIIGGPAIVGGRKRFLEMVVERYSTTGSV